MARKKQPAIGNKTISKGKCIATVGGITPKQPQPQPCRGRVASASSQGVAEDTNPLSMYEGQLLQMFADMKEIAKQ